MRAKLVVPVLVSSLLAGCSGQPPSAEQRNATDLNPSGRPYVGPRGVMSSMPPADTNPDRLFCHPEGPGTTCSRPDGAGD